MLELPGLVGVPGYTIPDLHVTFDVIAILDVKAFVCLDCLVSVSCVQHLQSLLGPAKNSGGWK